MTEESVKVAVRVRPFNKREKAMSAELIVEMKNSTTILRNPEEPNEEPRSFTFDHSYWSFDGSREKGDGYIEPDPGQASKNYCDQKMVFDDLGVGVLTNAWEGYNSTLFAYGQTGSGKSWSVVGYGINKGIVPQFCENLYKDIEKRRSEGAECEYEVNFSMLEIYNEQVRDLLSNKKAARGGLKVRQHPKKGFYAEGLTSCPVSSYAEIEDRMEEGTTNRTVASTNMNATSSRAHTVVGIHFLQKFKNAAGEETTKSAIVNLVDLAGSERAENTGATGDRLKEGANINKSLSSLGNCIAALADRSQGKDVKVPFRDSVLTKLLKNALGGNSKTVMIAAISPADVNYAETLSTLRYADRAKQIKTKVSVNEDPTEKLIRDLQEENERLKQMLESGSMSLPTGTGEDGIEEEEGMSPEEIEELKKQLKEEMEAELADNAREMEEMKKSFQEKLEASQKSDAAQVIALNAKKKATTPHLSNLNFDPQLSGRILHFIEDEKLVIGNGKDESVNIILKGPSIQPKHAEIENTEEGIKIRGCADHALINVNGVPLEGTDTLSNGDRLIFGTTQYYVFLDPRKPDETPEVDISQISFEMAQEELAQNSVGGPVAVTDRPQEARQQAVLQEELAMMLPAVQQANSIAEDLNKQRKFELVLTPPEGRGDVTSNQMQLYVKVTELDTGMEWMWSQRKFEARKFKMEEIFDKFENNEEWQVPENEDPFIEEPSVPIHIGSVKVWLIGLAHCVDTDEVDGIDIIDYRGYSMGKLSLMLQPCDENSRPLTAEEALEVDEPHEMVDRNIHFLVKLKGARLYHSRFTDLCCRYRLLPTDEFTETKLAYDSTAPVWNHEKLFSFCPMTKEVVVLLATGAMSVELWGRQVRSQLSKPKLTNKRQLTRGQTMMQLAQGQYVAGSVTSAREMQVNPEKVKFTFQMACMKKRQAKLEQKMKWLRTAVALADDRQVRSIPVACLKGLLDAQSENKAQGCYALIVKGKR